MIYATILDIRWYLNTTTSIPYLLFFYSEHTEIDCTRCFDYIYYVEPGVVPIGWHVSVAPSISSPPLSHLCFINISLSTALNHRSPMTSRSSRCALAEAHTFSGPRLDVLLHHSKPDTHSFGAVEWFFANGGDKIKFEKNVGGVVALC